MKKILTGLLILLSTLLFANNASNQQIIEDAERLFEQSIDIQGAANEHYALKLLTAAFENNASLFNHDVPTSGKQFFLACTKGSLQFIWGGNAGRCVGYSLSSKGSIKYIPATLIGLSFGIAGGVQYSEIDVIRLNGLNNIRKMDTIYFTGDVGFTPFRGVEGTLFTIGLNGAGKAFNADEKKGVRINVLNFSLVKININFKNKMNSIQLPSYILNNLKY